jgi:hypothetical protein
MSRPQLAHGQGPDLLVMCHVLAVAQYTGDLEVRAQTGVAGDRARSPPPRFLVTSRNATRGCR